MSFSTNTPSQKDALDRLAKEYDGLAAMLEAIDRWKKNLR
jgi:hypothetical protein